LEEGSLVPDYKEGSGFQHWVWGIRVGLRVLQKGAKKTPLTPARTRRGGREKGGSLGPPAAPRGPIRALAKTFNKGTKKEKKKPAGKMADRDNSRKSGKKKKGPGQALPEKSKNIRSLYSPGA